MQSGEVLGGRFEIEHVAGSGGMGVVYRALDRQTQSKVAVKVLYRRTIQDLQRFQREATCLAALDHPGIVRYLAHGIDGEQAYLAMEWLDGESLAARLDRARLTLAEAVALASRVAEALDAAHRAGVIHRDLKPSNLFLVDGVLDRVSVIDFGLARGDGSAPITATGATLGTPGYMAPEQVRRPRDVDHRADLFSLGCVLFHALTGKPPYRAADPLVMMMATASEDAPRVSAIVSGVPAVLDDLVARLLSRDPGERPEDVAIRLRAIEAEIKAQRLGWSVPRVQAEAPGSPNRETMSAGAAPLDVPAKRAFRPGEPIDARASTVTPDAAPIDATLHAAHAAHAAEPSPTVDDPVHDGLRSDPRARPSAAAPGSGDKAASGPQPASAPRANMHPATAALLTLLVVLVVLGGSCSACVYCTCLAPSSGPRAATTSRASAKDAGAPSRAAPRPTAR